MTILLGFSAVNTGNNLLFLLVSGMLAFMSVTGVAGMYNIKGLLPELLPPEEVFAGTAAPFRLVIRNSKKILPSFLVRVECQSGPFLVFPFVGGLTSSEGYVMLVFKRRGYMAVDRITVSSDYPVGFFTRYWTYETGSKQLVYPKPISGVSHSSDDDNKRAGQYLRRERGQDGELERIDPYSGVEPLRLIHWKLSARSSDFLVKGFGRQTATPLTIDVGSIQGAGVDEKVSRAAWLVQRWVRERPVGLVLGDRVIPAGCGKHHGRLLLEALATYGLD